MRSARRPGMLLGTAPSHRGAFHGPTHPHLEEAMTEGQATLVACPAFLGHDGAARCGLPAEVEARYIVRSTDGPLESARIRCPRGHWFNGPIESLTFGEHQDAAAEREAIARLKGSIVR